MSFYDPIESTFYGWCVERLLTSERLAPLLAAGVVEIGTGTATPVLDALRRSESAVRIRGYERDPQSYLEAFAAVEKAALPNYTVEEGDFFAGAVASGSRCAIGNPPYLPAVQATIGAPELWGGANGCDVARGVLSCGFDAVMLMTASISDPEGIIRHGRAEGYAVHDWMIRPIPFGPYCRDRAVRARIAELADSGRAFFTEDSYLLAGVTWVRGLDQPDGSGMLARMLTGAGTATRVGGPLGPLHRWPESATTGGRWRRSEPAAAACAEDY